MLLRSVMTAGGARQEGAPNPRHQLRRQDYSALQGGQWTFVRLLNALPQNYLVHAYVHFYVQRVHGTLVVVDHSTKLASARMSRSTLHVHFFVLHLPPPVGVSLLTAITRCAGFS